MRTAITLVTYLFWTYSFLLLIRVVLSWVNSNPYGRTRSHPLVRAVFLITEPVLAPLRRIIPPIGGAIDISPAVALVLLEIIRVIVIGILSRL